MTSCVAPRATASRTAASMAEVRSAMMSAETSEARNRKPVRPSRSACSTLASRFLPLSLRKRRAMGSWTSGTGDASMSIKKFLRVVTVLTLGVSGSLMAQASKGKTAETEKKADAQGMKKAEGHEKTAVRQSGAGTEAATKAEAKKPEATKAEGKKPEATKAEGKKPEATKAEGKKPAATKAEGKKPTATKAEGKSATSNKPDAKKP